MNTNPTTNTFTRHVRRTMNNDLHTFMATLISAFSAAFFYTAMTNVANVPAVVLWILGICTAVSVIYRIAHAIVTVKIRKDNKLHLLSDRIVNVHVLASSMINQEIPVPVDHSECVKSLEEIQTIANGLVEYYEKMVSQQENRFATMYNNNPPEFDRVVLERTKKRYTFINYVSCECNKVLAEMKKTA